MQINNKHKKTIPPVHKLKDSIDRDSVCML